MANCVPCEERKAARDGLVLAIKTSAGFASGAWGMAFQGDVVAVPPELLAQRPHDFSPVLEESSADTR